MPPEYYEYRNFTVRFGVPEHYEVNRKAKLGEGKYAEVFLGTDLKNNETVVMKFLKPVKSYKI
jgi:hypothetical protein